MSWASPLTAMIYPLCPHLASRRTKEITVSFGDSCHDNPEFDDTSTTLTRERILAVPVVSSDTDAISASSSDLSPWMIEIVSAMRHVVSLVSSNSSKPQSSALPMMFIARGGMPCVSGMAAALSQLSRNPRVDAASAGEILDLLASGCTPLDPLPPPQPLLLCTRCSLFLLQWTHACDYSSKPRG